MPLHVNKCRLNYWIVGLFYWACNDQDGDNDKDNGDDDNNNNKYNKSFVIK